MLLSAIALVSLGGNWYFWHQTQTLSATHTKTQETLQETLHETEQTLASTTAALDFATNTVASLLAEIDALEADKDDLTDNLRDEKNRNEAFVDQISEIAGTVGVLDKLSKTDKELLQKYSKVYFLNEHYVPEGLSEIQNEWKYNESRTFYLHSKVMPYFEEMLEAAKEDGIDLWVVSAYRSFDEQAALKGAYTVTYGSGANTFSADQGYSEHQLGTTVDFTTSGIGGGLAGFGDTAAYQWLLENAYRYGFILSYPENNTYYVYEPWHWRFVGVELAKDLHRKDDSFYDWDQRTIDEYLVNIFD